MRQPMPPNTRSAYHQRFLATRIRVALSSTSCSKEVEQSSVPSPQQEQLDLGEVDWLAEIKKLYRQWKFPSFLMFISYNRPMKSNVSNKKPRFEISYDDEEDHFLVPDLGWM
ncbi:unnamed protein product [Brassica rapa subsp. trilocularis]